VDLMNTTGLYSLANRKARDPIHVHPHSGAVGGRLPQRSSSFFTTPQSRTTSWTMMVITC
jgi:hypothetical protein